MESESNIQRYLEQQRKIRDYASDNNLTQFDLQVLIYLKLNGKSSMGEIHKNLGGAQSTVSTALKKLWSNKPQYITISLDQQDTRKHITLLTEEGQKTINNLEKLLN